MSFLVCGRAFGTLKVIVAWAHGYIGLHSTLASQTCGKEELWLCTIETRHRYTGWLRTWRMHETSVSAYTSIR